MHLRLSIINNINLIINIGYNDFDLILTKILRNKSTVLLNQSY